MLSIDSDLGERAFGPGADDLVTFKSRSQRDAFEFMQRAIRSAGGVGLVHGPAGSGKTTVVRQVVRQFPADTAVAIVDGSRVRPGAFLSDMLTQFGHDVELQSPDELLRLASMFVVQQTRSNRAPVLIVEHADQMFPSALRTLGILATLAAHGRFALRMLLISRQPMDPILEAEGMASIVSRADGAFELGPLQLKETMFYLHRRLSACGIRQPDSVFPVDLCDRLHEKSRGYPGVLNKLARKTLEQMSVGGDTNAQLQVSATELDEPAGPVITVSKDGAVVLQVTMDEPKLLIGRSRFADIVIDDRFVSKCHVLLLAYPKGLVLMDLNSGNGTLVNSVRTTSAVLQDNDVISLGHYRIKVENVPDAIMEPEQLAIPDTTRMKTLADLRRMKAEEILRDREQARKPGVS